MTAFARATAQLAQGTLTWELRSVNHRYLEVSFFRLGEEFRAFESHFRQIIKDRVSRGKIDAVLVFESNTSTLDDFVIDEVLVTRLNQSAKRVAELLGVQESLDVKSVLKWPGVIQTPTVDQDEIGLAAQTLLEDALTQFIECRRREGAKLKTQMENRLNQMSGIVTQLRQELPQIQALQRETLQNRLQEMLEKIDADRLEQELVYYAQKMDVHEELDRLDAHITETKRAFEQKEPSGRRLDFLMQEFNREANTLGSKSVSMLMTQASVNLKVLIDQVREQIQNIE
ncbi:MAG: YicC family protein [Gammaproteobacteria bacterium]|nr:YicC family protein [Gammaproteobacteria bacterium]